MLLTNFLQLDERICSNNADNKTITCLFEYYTQPAYKNKNKTIDYSSVMNVYNTLSSEKRIMQCIMRIYQCPKNCKPWKMVKSLLIVPLRIKGNVMGFLIGGTYNKTINVDETDKKLPNTTTIISSAFDRDASKKAIERDYRTQLYLKEISTLLSSNDNIADNIQKAISMIGDFLRLRKNLYFTNYTTTKNSVMPNGHKIGLVKI